MSDAAARAATELPPGLISGANAAQLQAHERSERWSLLGLTSPAIVMVLIIMVLPVGWLSWNAISSGFWAQWFWVGVVLIGMITPLTLNWLTPSEVRHKIGRASCRERC